MATTVISGRVDTLVAKQAQIVIKRAGMTPGEVIKGVWENIARTGEVPKGQASEDGGLVNEDALKRLDKVRAKLSQCERLHTLTDDQMKEMFANRDA